MREVTNPTRQVHQEMLARIISPDAFAQRDKAPKDPLACRRVQQALDKAEAIQAAQDLQLAYGRHVANPDWPPSPEALAQLMNAAEATGQAIHAAMEVERLRVHGTARALAALWAVRPTNWNDDEDPAGSAAWRGAQQALKAAAGFLTSVSPTDPQAQPMETAPKTGLLVRLLVDYSAETNAAAISDTEAAGYIWCPNPLDDTATLAWTIGFNNLSNDGQDRWQLAGWCWSQDHFTEGHGSPVGWLPFHAAEVPANG